MGFCGKVAFKNARAMIFLKLGRRTTNFGQVQKNLDFLDGRLPLPESTSPEKSKGEGGGG